MYNTTHHKIILLLITHTHTHTHTHRFFFFFFAVLRRLNNVYSVLTVARLGHSSCGNLPLGATVKRESGKNTTCRGWIPCVLHHSVVSSSLQPPDCSQPGSSVHGILQARILDWVAMPSSRGSSQPKDQIRISCIGRWILCHWATWEAWRGSLNPYCYFEIQKL